MSGISDYVWFDIRPREGSINLMNIMVEQCLNRIGIGMDMEHGSVPTIIWSDTYTECGCGFDLHVMESYIDMLAQEMINSGHIKFLRITIYRTVDGVITPESREMELEN